MQMERELDRIRQQEREFELQKELMRQRYRLERLERDANDIFTRPEDFRGF